MKKTLLALCQFAKQHLALLLVVAIFALGLSGAVAAPADATDIIADASTAFDTISALVVAIVGFFIIVRLVKKVSA